MSTIYTWAKRTAAIGLLAASALYGYSCINRKVQSALDEDPEHCTSTTIGMIVEGLGRGIQHLGEKVEEDVSPYVGKKIRSIEDKLKANKQKTNEEDACPEDPDQGDSADQY